MGSLIHRCLALLAILGGAVAQAADRAEALSLTCNGCHGPDGVSFGEHIPSIAGQNAEYLFRVLQEFRDGEREATIMGRVARGYPVYDLRKIAGYFAAREWRYIPPPPLPGDAARGADLHGERCAECHEDSGRYSDKDVPRIAGQREHYLFRQLVSYARQVPGLPQPTKMAEALDGLSMADLAALSHYYRQVQ